jgi:hypothetical protein
MSQLPPAKAGGLRPVRRAPLSRSRRPAIAQLPSVEQAESCRPDQKTHFLSRSLCNQLLKRILNRFRISEIWATSAL